MKTTYHHFTFEERVQLEAYLKANWPYRKIRDALDKSLGAISREIHSNSPNGGKGEYRAGYANLRAADRRYASVRENPSKSPRVWQFVYEKLREPKAETGATLYLNIGHMVTNLSILENGVTRVVRDVFISGNTLTKSIMKSLQVDAAKAEELKKTHGVIVDAAEKEKALAEGNREALGVSQTIAAVIKDLVAEVHRSVDFYLSQGPERSIGRIVLSGGSARLKNLAKHLSSELKVPVSVLEPFAFLKNPPADLPPELTPAFGVAVGLALRHNKDWL